MIILFFSDFNSVMAFCCCVTDDCVHKSVIDSLKWKVQREAPWIQNGCPIYMEIHRGVETECGQVLCESSYMMLFTCKIFMVKWLLFKAFFKGHQQANR